MMQAMRPLSVMVIQLKWYAKHVLPTLKQAHVHVVPELCNNVTYNVIYNVSTVIYSDIIIARVTPALCLWIVGYKLE